MKPIIIVLMLCPLMLCCRTSASGAVFPVRTYRRFNVRDWVVSSDNNVFSYDLYYNSPVLENTVPMYAGNISQWSWKHADDVVENSYAIYYDKLGRLSSGLFYENGTRLSDKNEESITYDLNGNIRSMRRWSDSGQLTAEYSYGYNKSNRLTSILLEPVAPYPRAVYDYDLNGNIVSDGLHGLSLGYNHQNLVNEIRSIATDSIRVRYSYLPDGTRTSAMYDDSGISVGQLYVGNMIFKKSGETLSFESVPFNGGRVATSDSGAMSVRLHLLDHLGSVRAVVDGSTGSVLERDDYYPFGTRWASSSPTLSTNWWRYNGKELQTFASVPYINYGARMYDSDSGRWFVPDPLAEEYCSISPYAFCADNPVNFIDPDGEIPLLTNLVGGLASAAVDYVGQAAANVITGGFNADVFTNIDIGDIAISFAEGFVTSGGNLVKKVVTKTAVAVVSEIARNAVDVKIDNDNDVTVKTNSVSETAIKTTVGIAFGSVKTGVNVAPLKSKTPNSAVKSARAKGQGNGLSKDKAKAIAKKTKANNETKKKINKTLTDNTNSTLGNSVGSIVKNVLFP